MISCLHISVLESFHHWIQNSYDFSIKWYAFRMEMNKIEYTCHSIHLNDWCFIHSFDYFDRRRINMNEWNFYLATQHIRQFVTVHLRCNSSKWNYKNTVHSKSNLDQQLELNSRKSLFIYNSRGNFQYEVYLIWSYV